VIVIDALLKDGRPALADLQGASPSGGQVRSESRVVVTLTPGDLMRHNGEWAVVWEVAHHGGTGLTRLLLLTADSMWRNPGALAAGQSVEVRTDARIDPGTLWKLTP
jgi:hypothetical protein